MRLADFEAAKAADASLAEAPKEEAAFEAAIEMVANDLHETVVQIAPDLATPSETALTSPGKEEGGSG